MLTGTVSPPGRTSPAMGSLAIPPAADAELTTILERRTWDWSWSSHVSSRLISGARQLSELAIAAVWGGRSGCAAWPGLCRPWSCEGANLLPARRLARSRVRRLGGGGFRPMATAITPAGIGQLPDESSGDRGPMRYSNRSPARPKPPSSAALRPRLDRTPRSPANKSSG